MNIRDHIPQMTERDRLFIAEQVEGMPVDLGRLKGMELAAWIQLEKLWDIHRAAQVEAFGGDDVSNEAFNALPAWQQEQLQINVRLSIYAMEVYKEAEQEFTTALGER